MHYENIIRSTSDRDLERHHIVTQTGAHYKDCCFYLNKSFGYTMITMCIKQNFRMKCANTNSNLSILYQTDIVIDQKNITEIIHWHHMSVMSSQIVVKVIWRWPLDFPHKGPVMQKALLCHDFIMKDADVADSEDEHSKSSSYSTCSVGDSKRLPEHFRHTWVRELFSQIYLWKANSPLPCIWWCRCRTPVYAWTRQSPVCKWHFQMHSLVENYWV